MKNKSKIFGEQAEEQARQYLLSKGYEILETNWRFKKYEVDIIAKIGQTLVFVEVKARSNAAFGEPELFVTRQKQSFLVTAANHYIVTNDIELEARFDVIALLNVNNSSTVKHLEAAFYPLLK